MEARTIITGLIFTALHLCCMSSENQNVRYFKEIDIFTLKGQIEILHEEAKFPYVEIDSIQLTEKKITLLFSKDQVVKYSYKREGLNWVSSRISERPDNIYYHFDIITPGKK